MSSKCNILAELDKSQPQEGKGRAGSSTGGYRHLALFQMKKNGTCRAATCNLQRQNVRQQQQAESGEWERAGVQSNHSTKSSCPSINNSSSSGKDSDLVMPELPQKNERKSAPASETGRDKTNKRVSKR